MYKTGRKVIASLLVFILTMAHLSTLGEAIASNLEDQSAETNVANVEFDMYFKQGEEKVHSSTKTIGAENYIYAAIEVKDAGYLKNAQIKLQEPNFEISEELTADKVSKVNGNKIELNRIKAGKNIEIEIPIAMIETNGMISPNELNKQSDIKLTGTYVDEKGKEKSVEKSITINLGWTAETNAELNMQVSKFVPYSINENKGLILQTLMQSYLKDNTLPVKENKIEISVPSINGIKPQEIKVLANTTKASNGDETAENFTDENYVYNSEENKLTITVKNEANQDGQVSWKKQAQDEFIITYIYSEEALNSISEEGVKVSISANNEITVYGATLEKVNKEFSGEITLKDQISDLLDFTISTNIESISKGQIYANYQVENKIETGYSQTITANVALAKLTDKIVLEQSADNFVIDEDTKMPATQTYYKTISVDEKEFNKLLGEEGEIYFYTGTTQIAKISKDIKVNEQGKLVVDLSEFNINNLRIETSKPKIEGKLSFDIVKAIKGETGYSKTQMRSFNALELNLSAKAVNEVAEFANQSLVKAISFIEPTSKAELTIDNNNLSTVVTNKDVKMTAVLRTDSLDCMLYINPSLQITLPAYIENIDIKNIEVLFDTEATKLTLKSHQLIQNEDGTKTIIITLEGMQTEYTLGAVSKGVNIVITSDITVNKLTPNKQEQITMQYTNSNVITRARTAMQEVGTTSTNISFVAPTGVVTTNAISNYKEGAEKLTSISGEEKVATIDIMAEARNANFNMSVINNYNNTIDNISILGRTLFTGNKDIVSEEDLDSTMNMLLTSNITVTNVDATKVKVYYSENGEATKDLENEANAWTETPTSLENVKSYLIVLTDHSMNTADTINFGYTAQIPANLQYNESAYETFVVYFNNNLETGKIEDKQVATKIGVTTGKGPVLESTMTSNVEETQEVLTEGIIKYTLTVKNTGTENANDVVATLATQKENEQGNTELVLEIPEGLKYVEPDEEYPEIYEVKAYEGRVDLNLGTIAPNETITKEIYMQVDYLTEDTIVSNIKAIITASNTSAQVETNTLKNTLVRRFFKIDGYVTTETGEVLSEGDSLQYNYTISLYEDGAELENTIATMKIPEGLTYQDAKIRAYNIEEEKEEEITEGIEYNDKTRALTINLGKTTSSIKGVIEIDTIVDKLADNEYEREIQTTISVKADAAKEEISSPIINTVAKEDVKITQTSTILNGYTITAGENYSYIFEIENIGGKQAESLTFKTIIPEQLEYKATKIEITENNGIYKNETYSISENNEVEISLGIEKGKKAKITIDVVAKEITESKTVSSVGTVSSDKIEAKTSNEIKHLIEAVNYDNKEDITDIRRKILGQVWQDSNNDGIKDKDEEKLSNVEVMLFNNKTAELVRNSEGEVLRQYTDENGTYTFDKVPQGKYTVIYLYDVANYSATVYRKENVDNTVNSDAVDANITLDGVTRVAAITEEILINDSNIYNIDLGLVSNPKFDLKLDKTVSKITVVDANETKVYDYKDEKLAKKDLVGKQINNTTIIVEYKIKVTNEGAIAGFVKKIADYMPVEMKFNSELNRDWYTGDNGILLNSSLANTAINPGETKEVTLTLTKKMTEDNLGLYHNEAEIYEAYNDLGLEDVDSKVANKISNEDDMSSADVIITVKTGEVILFVGLSLSIIITIGISVYFIRRKILA